MGKEENRKQKTENKKKRNEHKMKTMNRLQVKYQQEFIPLLKKELGLKSEAQVPRLEKITVNSCVSEAVKNPKVLNTVVEEITVITGQRAVITKSKKAISNFKLRAGVPLGVKVTLRRNRMWAFLDRLNNLALPRVRDFRGLSVKGFDGRGNYTLGVKEHIVFPEINYDKVDKIRGMNITICTTATSDQQGKALLGALGVPFRN